MIYGYLRVSSDEQDVNSQKQGVEAFAEQHGWKIEKFISDEGVSGGKDPDKRNLGPMLKKLMKGDIVIASEISRIGRDLYMVMDILHFCMKQEVVIYTVKDRFVLGDDIQSKVLAFAFGLAAEIERQMIRQRTKEGLRLRMKMGVLVGRCPGSPSVNSKFHKKMDAKKTMILNALDMGFSQRKIAKKMGIDRNTLSRNLARWRHEDNGCDETYVRMVESQRNYVDKRRKCSYKDTPYRVVDLPREQVVEMILKDMTIPEIHQALPQFTYEEVYDTFICDREFNTLYRQHAQNKLRKKKY